MLFWSLSLTEAARSVRLVWDPNPEPDDYILQYGTRTGKPTRSLEVGKKTTAAVSDLEDGTTYYFVVVARNSRGVESPPSNEVSFTTETPTSIGSSNVLIGETNVLGTADFGNGNLLVAQRANLTETATIRSLSFYVTNARGKLRLGIFDATGRNGGPGKKKAETAEITPKVGWNTANVTVPVSLPRGPYWLAYLASDNNLAFVKTLSGLAKYYAYPYGPMPTTFFSSPTTEVVHWSLFANLNTPGIQLPTHTLVVLNGTGSGRYAQGKQIQVSANPPASGKRFDGWARDWQILTNPFIPTTTALMLSRDLTIEATYASVAGNDKIRYYPREGYAQRMVGGVFEGTNGDPIRGTYFGIYMIKTKPPLAWTEVSANLENFRYLRYRGPDGSYGNVAEIEFYRKGLKVRGVAFGTPGSWNNNGNTFSKALDGNVGTPFDGPTANSVYVGVDTKASASVAPSAP